MFCLPLSLRDSRYHGNIETYSILIIGRIPVSYLPRGVTAVSQTEGCVLSFYTNFCQTYARQRQESAAGAKCARRRRTAYETGIHNIPTFQGYTQEISTQVLYCGHTADVHRFNLGRMGRQDGFRRVDIRRQASSARIGRGYGQIQQRISAV